jgi:hypothetical protein
MLKLLKLNGYTHQKSFTEKALDNYYMTKQLK